MSQTVSPEVLRNAWLERLSQLVKQIKQWAEEAGWSTRPIEVSLTDSQLGRYKAPALLMQENAIRVLLEPIARSAPGADGVVDLYLIPAYDDIASLYLCDGTWRIHYMFPGTPPVATLRKASAEPISAESFRAVLESMKANVD